VWSINIAVNDTKLYLMLWFVYKYSTVDFSIFVETSTI
jgi:hypothetical protein